MFAELPGFKKLIVQGTREGLAAARARGRVGGRPPVATEEVIRAARDLLPDSGRSITSIAKLLGVSPGALTRPKGQNQVSVLPVGLGQRILRRIGRSVGYENPR